MLRSLWTSAAECRPADQPGRHHQQPGQRNTAGFKRNGRTSPTSVPDHREPGAPVEPASMVPNGVQVGLGTRVVGTSRYLGQGNPSHGPAPGRYHRRRRISGCFFPTAKLPIPGAATGCGLRRAGGQRGRPSSRTRHRHPRGRHRDHDQPRGTRHGTHRRPGRSGGNRPDRADQVRQSRRTEGHGEEPLPRVARQRGPHRRPSRSRWARPAHQGVLEMSNVQVWTKWSPSSSPRGPTRRTPRDSDGGRTASHRQRPQEVAAAVNGKKKETRDALRSRLFFTSWPPPSCLLSPPLLFPPPTLSLKGGLPRRNLRSLLLSERPILRRPGTRPESGRRDAFRPRNGILTRDALLAAMTDHGSGVSASSSSCPGSGGFPGRVSLAVIKRLSGWNGSGGEPLGPVPPGIPVAPPSVAPGTGSVTLKYATDRERAVPGGEALLEPPRRGGGPAPWSGERFWTGTT